jgi:hypothetical protein
MLKNSIYRKRKARQALRPCWLSELRYFHCKIASIRRVRPCPMKPATKEEYPD